MPDTEPAATKRTCTGLSVPASFGQGGGSGVISSESLVNSGALGMSCENNAIWSLSPQLLQAVKNGNPSSVSALVMVDDNHELDENSFKFLLEILQGDLTKLPSKVLATGTGTFKTAFQFPPGGVGGRWLTWPNYLSSTMKI